MKIIKPIPYGFLLKAEYGYFFERVIKRDRQIRQCSQETYVSELDAVQKYDNGEVVWI